MALWDKLTSSKDKDEKRAKELWDRAIKYYEGKLFNRGLKDLQEAIDLNPDYGNEAMELMQTFSSQGNEEQALSVGFALIKMDPRNVELINKLGNSLRNIRSFDKAKRLYTRALKIKPDYKEAQYNLAGSTFRITTADGGLISQTRKVESIKLPRRYEFQGTRVGYQEVPNESFEEKKDSNKQDKEEEDEENQPTEEELAVMREGFINELKKDVESNPGTWDYEFNLALLYDLFEYGELAIQHYRTAKEIEPENRMSINNLAVALMVHKKEHSEAETLLLKNLGEHRYDRTTVHNLAILYRNMGKSFQTLKYFVYLGDLLDKSLMDYETGKMEAHAQQLFERRKYMEAVPVFENLATEKQQPFWLEKLAVMYLNQKKEDMYIGALKRLLRLEPDSEDASQKLNALADGYEEQAQDKIKKGSKNHAIQLMMQAVKIVETPERWVELAQLYEDEGEDILAENALKRWKQLSGGDESQPETAKPETA